MNGNQEKKEKMAIKEYFNFNPILNYYFRKKDPNRKNNFNLKVMHGINKISILMFLGALVLMLLRFFLRD